MPKQPSPRNKKVAPFAVKRKQINFNLLDTPISRNSSQLSMDSPSSHNLQLLKEKDDTITQLKKDLDKLNKELQNTRHQSRLMENERQQFESSVQEKYEKEYSNVALELKLLKETHTDKVQHLSLTIDQLYKKLDYYKHLLNTHKIQYNDDDSIDTMLTTSIDPTLSSFIKDAYDQSKLPINTTLQWRSLQKTTMALKNEINQFNAWKSIPIHDLIKVLEKDQKSTVKSLLFGRKKY